MKRSAPTSHKRESGFSLVEIIVAAGIISVALVSLIQIGGQSIAFSRRSVNVYVAATLLEEGVESVKIIRDNGWSNISVPADYTNYYSTFSTSTNMWSLSATSSSIGMFTRTITFAPVSRNASYDIAATGTAVSSTRLVTVTVSWQDSIGAISKTISFYINDIFS